MKKITWVPSQSHGRLTGAQVLLFAALGVGESRLPRRANFAHVEHEDLVVDGCGQQHPVVAPAHLAELGLELGFAGHVVRSVALGAVARGADAPADLTLEEMRWLLVIFKRLLVPCNSTRIVGNFPTAESLLASGGEHFIVGTECHALDAAFSLDGRQLTVWLHIATVPDRDASVLAACRQKQLRLRVVAPLHNREALTSVFKNSIRRRTLAFPQADTVI